MSKGVAVEERKAGRFLMLRWDPVARKPDGRAFRLTTVAGLARGLRSVRGAGLRDARPPPANTGTGTTSLSIPNRVA